MRNQPICLRVSSKTERVWRVSFVCQETRNKKGLSVYHKKRSEINFYAIIRPIEKAKHRWRTDALNAAADDELASLSGVLSTALR